MYHHLRATLTWPARDDYLYHHRFHIIIILYSYLPIVPLCINPLLENSWSSDDPSLLVDIQIYILCYESKNLERGGSIVLTSKTVPVMVISNSFKIWLIGNSKGCVSVWTESALRTSGLQPNSVWRCHSVRELQIEAISPSSFLWRGIWTALGSWPAAGGIADTRVLKTAEASIRKKIKERISICGTGEWKDNAVNNSAYNTK
jgi:hypothetical protein